MGQCLLIRSSGGHKVKILHYDDLLFWLDGTDFIDHSLKHRTITNNGNVITEDPALSLTYPMYKFPNSLGLQLSNSATHNFSAFSSSVWIKSVSRSTWATIYSIGFTSGGGDTFELRNNFSSTGCFGYAGRNDSSGNSIDQSTGITSTDNVWWHIVTTVDGKICKTFLNGVLRSTVTLSYDIGTSTPPNWYIGRCQFSTSGEFFNGWMTDIRAWSRILTDAEAISLWEAGPQTHLMQK